MFATIRRYDGVDVNRSAELTRKVNETLVPKLEKLSGFNGYYLIDAGNGVFTSLGLFETPEQGTESTKIVATVCTSTSASIMFGNRRHDARRREASMAQSTRPPRRRGAPQERQRALGARG